MMTVVVYVTLAEVTHRLPAAWACRGLTPTLEVNVYTPGPRSVSSTDSSHHS